MWKCFFFKNNLLFFFENFVIIVIFIIVMPRHVKAFVLVTFSTCSLSFASFKTSPSYSSAINLNSLFWRICTSLSQSFILLCRIMLDIFYFWHNINDRTWISSNYNVSITFWAVIRQNNYNGQNNCNRLRTIIFFFFF